METRGAPLASANPDVINLSSIDLSSVGDSIQPADDVVKPVVAPTLVGPSVDKSDPLTPAGGITSVDPAVPVPVAPPAERASDGGLTNKLPIVPTPGGVPVQKSGKSSISIPGLIRSRRSPGLDTVLGQFQDKIEQANAVASPQEMNQKWTQ